VLVGPGFGANREHGLARREAADQAALVESAPCCCAAALKRTGRLGGERTGGLRPLEGLSIKDSILRHLNGAVEPSRIAPGTVKRYFRPWQAHAARACLGRHSNNAAGQGRFLHTRAPAACRFERWYSDVLFLERTRDGRAPQLAITAVPARFFPGN
jgi:hypothetical protein